MASKSVSKFSDSIIKQLEQNNTLTCNSLELRAYKSGKKTWSFTYRFGSNRKHRRLTIGEYPYFSIADANDAVAAARKLIALGIDPVEHEKESIATAKREMDEAITVQDLYDIWYERHVMGTPLSITSQKQYKTEVNKHILPILGASAN